MDQKIFTILQNDIFHRLASQLPDGLSYHDLSHTRDDVLPGVQQLCTLCNVSNDDQQLVLCAGLFHDIGYIKQYHANEEIGAVMSAEIMADMGINSTDIAIISQLIISTKMPQQPHSRLAEILCDADLATLGKDDFYKKSLLLRQELAFVGSSIRLDQWHKDQYDFLQNHHYFTQAARDLWDAGKRANIVFLEQVMCS